MELEFEGMYKSGIFVAAKGKGTGAKKRYALLMDNGEMKVRGFEVVRRNLSPIAKETQKNVLMMILTGEKKEKILEFVKETVKRLKERKVPNAEVIIETRISRKIQDYSNLPPHVAVAKKMQEKGRDR